MDGSATPPQPRSPPSVDGRLLRPAPLTAIRSGWRPSRLVRHLCHRLRMQCSASERAGATVPPAASGRDIASRLANRQRGHAPGLATSTDGGPLRPQLDVSKKMSGDMALRPCCSGFVGAAGRASNRSARTFRLARADRQHRHARGAHDIRSVTLPKKARATLRRPCVAITMRSAWSSSAVFRISSRGSPLATMSRRRSIASSPGR